MIPARTVGESIAYEQGYRQAVRDIEKQGVDFARKVIAVMDDVPQFQPKGGKKR